VVVKLGTAVFDAPAPALIKLRKHGQVYGAGSDHEGDGEQRGPHGIGSSLAQARAGSLVQASDAQRKQVLWDVCFVAFLDLLWKLSVKPRQLVVKVIRLSPAAMPIFSGVQC
jgi:hypothetical protein